jgi:hypothetical protein
LAYSAKFSRASEMHNRMLNSLGLFSASGQQSLKQQHFTISRRTSPLWRLFVSLTALWTRPRARVFRGRFSLHRKRESQHRVNGCCGSRTQ